MIHMENPKTTAKKIAWPLIEIRDNQVGMIWVECDEQGNKGDKIRLSWDELYDFGIEDWMIRATINDALEFDNEFIRADVPVFHGVVEDPGISNETFRINPEIAEKLNLNGFEIITGQPTQFTGSGSGGYFAVGDHTEPVSENYVPEIVPEPDNPDTYRGSYVEDFWCDVSRSPFTARPLIYCNPHNGAEYFFCNVCKKAGRKNPWHPYILGNRDQGYDEQSMLTAIRAIGDGHSVYEIAKFCQNEFKDNWDKRKVLRICDKLSKFRKIRYEIETRNNRQVKLVFLNRD
jgi:hypothetical protein